MRIYRAVASIMLMLAVTGVACTRKSIHKKISPYGIAASTLPDEIKAAKQEGIPLLPEDLRRSAPVSDNQNAAPLYQRIARMLPVNLADASLRAVASGKASDVECQEANRVLVQVHSELDLAQQAAKLSHCDFHRDWNLGPDLPLLEYKPLRTMALLLATKATLQIKEGKPKEALRTIQTGLQLAHHIGEEPTAIALLMRMALESMMERPFEEVLRQFGNSPNILAIAAETNKIASDTPELRHAFQGEVVLCRAMTAIIRNGTDDMPSVARVLGESRQNVADAYEARSLSFWRRVFAATNRTPADPMATYLAITVVDDAEEKSSHDPNGNLRPTYELSTVANPYFAGVAEKVIINDARRRLRRTALALLAYRQQHNQFPASLTGLSSPIPADPFTSKPLRYRRTEQGCIVYSVGINRVDDSGIEGQQIDKEKPSDIVFSIP